MGGASWCHSFIFGLGTELFILSLLVGLGAVFNALVCRIWGEADEEAAIADRRMTAQGITNRRAA